MELKVNVCSEKGIQYIKINWTTCDSGENFLVPHTWVLSHLNFSL